MSARTATKALAAQLYRWVEEYAAEPTHHTGTAEDARTVAWFAGQLSQLGATVSRLPFTFDRYRAQWQVAIEGEPTVALPLFYGSVGSAATEKPFTAAVPVADGEAGIEQARARASDAPLAVVATTGQHDLLAVPNREPEPCLSMPTLLVAGAHAEAFGWAKIEASLSAEIVPWHAENVLGVFGRGERPLIIGTPLSGWFRCAGERGTGIAIALAAAQELTHDCPVVVLGASGHELNNWGLRSCIAALGITPRAVLHLGASVAAGDSTGQRPPAELSPSRRASVTQGALDHPALDAAVQPIGLTPRRIAGADAGNPRAWVGEAQQWCTLGVPLLSFAGGSALFHTPQDVPELATTPELLDRVCGAVIDAARLLIAAA